jgi:hypothetical protein
VRISWSTNRVKLLKYGLLNSPFSLALQSGSRYRSASISGEPEADKDALPNCNAGVPSGKAAFGSADKVADDVVTDDVVTDDDEDISLGGSHLGFFVPAFGDPLLVSPVPPFESPVADLLVDEELDVKKLPRVFCPPPKPFALIL